MSGIFGPARLMKDMLALKPDNLIVVNEVVGAYRARGVVARVEDSVSVGFAFLAFAVAFAACSQLRGDLIEAFNHRLVCYFYVGLSVRHRAKQSRTVANPVKALNDGCHLRAGLDLRAT